jgi:hypothetical protein
VILGHTIDAIEILHCTFAGTEAVVPAELIPTLPGEVSAYTSSVRHLAVDTFGVEVYVNDMPFQGDFTLADQP